MSHPLLAAGAGIVGSAAAAIGTVVAQATPGSGGGGDLIPWAQVGGSGIAVSILGYIAKKMLDGELVARSTVEREANLSNQVERALKREERWDQMLEDATEREDAFRILLMQERGRQ